MLNKSELDTSEDKVFIYNFEGDPKIKIDNGKI